MNVELESGTRNDEELANLAQKGDTEAFGVLVERYEIKLLRYGRKFLSSNDDIQDIVQNVFLRAYQNINSFDSLQRFSPWIYRIAHNAFVNSLRTKSRSLLSFVDFDTFTSHPVYEPTQVSEREQEEMKNMVEVGLAQLSSKYREVLILHYLEDMSYKDIGDVLQIPVGTVGIRLKRAKEALVEAYKKMNVPYELS